MNKSKYLNRIDYILEISKWEDNFVVTNIHFGGWSFETIHGHLSEWYKKQKQDYLIIANTESNAIQLTNRGIPEDRVLVRKEFTKLKKSWSSWREKNEEQFELFRKSEIILFDISDCRLLSEINFKFGISKKDAKSLTRKHTYWSTGHVINQEFERVLYYSTEINNKYLAKRKRVESIHKVLEDDV